MFLIPHKFYQRCLYNKDDLSHFIITGRQRDGNFKITTFRWSCLAGVTRYNILVATDQYFTNVVLQTQVPDTSYAVSSPLTEFTKYYWKVSGVNSQGNAGDYSSPQ